VADLWAVRVELPDDCQAREGSSTVFCCLAEAPGDAPRVARPVLAARYSAGSADSFAASIGLVAVGDPQDGLKALVQAGSLAGTRFPGAPLDSAVEAEALTLAGQPAQSLLLLVVARPGTPSVLLVNRTAVFPHFS